MHVVPWCSDTQFVLVLGYSYSVVLSSAQLKPEVRAHAQPSRPNIAPEAPTERTLGDMTADTIIENLGAQEPGVSKAVHNNIIILLSLWRPIPALQSGLQCQNRRSVAVVSLILIPSACRAWLSYCAAARTYSAAVTRTARRAQSSRIATVIH